MIEFQDGSCLYVTAAVRAASHFGKAQGDHSGQSKFKVHWNLSHSQVHTQRIQSNEARSLGVSSEVWFHRFSSPPFGSPFILSPSHTSVSSFFFHVLLSSCFVISSFPLFARTSVLALACTCTSTTQFLGRPGLDNEVRLIGCPCALGFSFIATTHTFAPSRPPLMSSSFWSFLRAHLHIRPSLNFCLPSGRRVCVPLVVTGILSCTLSFLHLGREHGTRLQTLSNKAMQSGGISSLASWTYLQQFQDL